MTHPGEWKTHQPNSTSNGSRASAMFSALNGCRGLTVYKKLHAHVSEGVTGRFANESFDANVQFANVLSLFANVLGQFANIL